MRFVYGDRIGRDAALRIGCSAVVLNPEGDQVLLTKRQDNGRWCLPSGAMEPGESAEEACVRETLEETGLVVSITRLVGVYSDPNVVQEYVDGNRYQLLGICFQAVIVGGDMSTSDETSDVRFVALKDLDQFDVIERHLTRIAHAVSGQSEAFFREPSRPSQ